MLNGIKERSTYPESLIYRLEMRWDGVAIAKKTYIPNRYHHLCIPCRQLQSSLEEILRCVVEVGGWKMISVLDEMIGRCDLLVPSSTSATTQEGRTQRTRSEQFNSRCPSWSTPQRVCVVLVPSHPHRTRPFVPPPGSIQFMPAQESHRSPIISPWFRCFDTWSLARRSCLLLTALWSGIIHHHQTPSTHRTMSDTTIASQPRRTSWTIQ